MLTAIKYLYNRLTDRSQYLEKMNAALDEFEDEKEKADTVTNQEETDKHDIENEVIMNSGKCFRKKGVITSLDSNHGTIDNKYFFKAGTILYGGESLKVGHKIEYLAYKASESDCVKVVKILEITDDYWAEEALERKIEQEIEDLRDLKPTYFSTHIRTEMGVVVRKDKHIMQIDCTNSIVDVELDQISMNFVPQVYDNVCLVCNVQTDEAFVDTAGEILDIIEVKPALTEDIKAPITELCGTYGRIRRDIYFSFDILPIGYKPLVNDIVAATIISVEMENSKFSWRAIKIALLDRKDAIEVAQFQRQSGYNRDKNGMNITKNISFDFDDVNEEKDIEIKVKNEGHTNQKLNKVFFKSKKSESQLLLVSPRCDESFIIKPDETLVYNMSCRSRYYGYNEETFVFNFDEYLIHRTISINVKGTDTSDNKENSLIPNSQIANRHRNAYARKVWTTKTDFVPGERVHVKPRFVAQQIPHYEVPEFIKRCILGEASNKEISDELDNLVPCLAVDLTFQNYVLRFSTLLHLEEVQYFLNMRQYDCERAHFSKEHEYLSLEIENLSEKRPSLVIGDSVRATNPWAEHSDSKTYEGVIHKVHCNRILMKFHNTFHNRYNGEDYKLEFLFSRYGFRKQHYSIIQAHRRLGADFLFPSKVTINEKIQLDVQIDEVSHKLKVTHSIDKTVSEKDWFNKDLNIIQKYAIRNILRGECRPMPYVIFGPPGTGKTMTIVETILQIVHLIPNSRILVGTPSNSAADLITERLINSKALNPGEFIRLLSQNTIERDMVPTFLKPFCATIDIAREGTSADNMIVTESGLKLRCQQKHLGRHRITISTCSTLGNLHQMEFKLGHFTHVLIDEAGQSMEPEAIVPISMVNKMTGQIILAGDPLQLGPIVLSKYAQFRGLEVSFLVRILDRTPYKKDTIRFPTTDGFDARLVTKLLFNYRSIPSILRTYNDLFYDAELHSFIDEENKDELDASSDISCLKLVRQTLKFFDAPPNHGVFFFAIRGENRQDEDSPSWYNPAEASQIYLNVILLYKAGISSDRIGIITPYQKQVKKIRNLFASTDIKYPKIGSVEEFQGQERDIILISTVRSTKSLVIGDLKQSLGFVKSSKRMNVAISRARAFLIVFGNPYLLSFDDSWKKFITYCQENNACLGAEFEL